MEDKINEIVKFVKDEIQEWSRKQVLKYQGKEIDWNAVEMDFYKEILPKVLDKCKGDPKLHAAAYEQIRLDWGIKE